MPMNLFGFKKQAIMDLPIPQPSPDMLSKLSGLLIIHLNSILTDNDDETGKTLYIFNNNLNHYQLPVGGQLQFITTPEGNVKISIGRNIYRIKHSNMVSGTVYTVSAGDCLYIEVPGSYDKLIPFFIELRIRYSIINNH